MAHTLIGSSEEGLWILERSSYYFTPVDSKAVLFGRACITSLHSREERQRHPLSNKQGSRKH